MTRLARASAALTLFALLVPARLMAHGGGEPLILVPLDHVTPGQTFPLTGADLGPNARVSFRLSLGGRVEPLGSVTAGADGHFKTELRLPEAFPTGYAHLVASGSDGSQAATWVLVGERAESAAAKGGGTRWWPYAAAILAVLAAVAAGAVRARRSHRARAS